MVRFGPGLIAFTHSLGWIPFFGPIFSKVLLALLQDMSFPKLVSSFALAGALTLGNGLQWNHPLASIKAMLGTRRTGGYSSSGL